jgi:hypothetical protein
MPFVFTLKGTRRIVDVSCSKDIAGMKQACKNLYADV